MLKTIRATQVALTESALSCIEAAAKHRMEAP